jgi:hypothetical protein
VNVTQGKHSERGGAKELGDARVNLRARKARHHEKGTVEGLAASRLGLKIGHKHVTRHLYGTDRKTDAGLMKSMKHVTLANLRGVRCEVWCVRYGVWCVVCGVWCVVCEVWCVRCEV